MDVWTLELRPGVREESASPVLLTALVIFAFGVFISQLIRYARACSSNRCFILRMTRLSNKLLLQGYVKERLKSSLRTFYGRYGDFIKQYEVSLSQMLNDILWPNHIHWQPLLIRLCTELDLFTEFWEICYGCGMASGNAYSSGHLVPSLLDLHMFYLLREILFPNLSYYPVYALRISLGTFSILLRTLESNRFFYILKFSWSFLYTMPKKKNPYRFIYTSV